MSTPATTDCLVIGGGIIGLSIAYELVRAGRTVRVVERGQPGREASWAGAGILPPGDWYGDHPALDALAAASRPLHAEWSEWLKDETGVDDEYQACGALYAITPETSEQLATKFAAWRGQGIAADKVDPREFTHTSVEFDRSETYFVPGEAQVRNPRRLAALRAACALHGVMIETESAVESFMTDADRIVGAKTNKETYVACQYCLAAGAWTGGLAKQLRLSIPINPIRGQMLLLRLPEQRLHRIYHEAGLYIVPRRDGRVLVGSTVEDVGFAKQTKPADIKALHHFACGLVPCLRDARIEGAWSGLRPASSDELPVIGRLPRFGNAWIATGHFRAGLQYAPATAVLIRRLLEDSPLDFDIRAFSSKRFTTDERSSLKTADVIRVI